ncbi:hypothetical protein D9M68_779550 [compost metagenome]
MALKLSKVFDQHQVILADYGEIPHISTAKYSLLSLGSRNENTLAHQLLTCCLDEGVEMIIPLHEFELSPLQSAALLFEEFNIHLALPAALSDYRQPERGNMKNWFFIWKGAILFSSNPDAHPEPFAPDEQLSGAFYLAEDPQGVAKLKLITI